MFPGRRGAGRIFRTQVRASGFDPAVRAVRPLGRGRRVHCGVLRLHRHGGRQRLDVPGQPARMVEMVVSEKTTLEEMGGARLHCTSLRQRALPGRDAEQDALGGGPATLPVLPAAELVLGLACGGRAAAREARRPGRLVPESERQAFDMRRFVRGLVDEDSFFEVHALWAREVVTGFARLDGQVTGVIANNPMFKGGVLFVDSADKAARFIQTCDAFDIRLLLPRRRARLHGRHRRGAPGDHQARREDDRGDVRRHRAEDLRRGAQGLRRGPLRSPARASSRTPRWPCPPRRSPSMGTEAAVNAVYADKLDQLDGDARAAETDRLRREYERDIDILRLASELVVNDVRRARGSAGRTGPPLRRRPRQGPDASAPPPRHQPA